MQAVRAAEPGTPTEALPPRLVDTEGLCAAEACYDTAHDELAFWYET